MPVSFCLEPACKFLSIPGSYRCAQHRTEHTAAWDKTRRDPAHVSFYASAAWRRMREQVLLDSPVCRCGSPSTDVDHVIALRDAWDRRLDRSNLQSMCASCHARKSQQERRIRGM